MDTYNIYCDESCHLEQDKSTHMILGGILCPKEQTREISVALRELKKKHGLSTKFELKWTKVGRGALPYYRDVIDFFLNNNLNFRAVVADKTHLRHDDFMQTHDEWYYKMYYLLLRNMVTPIDKFKIYVDIKDTRGGEKVKKLKDVLNHSLYTFYDEAVIGVQQIRSEESEILQLADFLIGAIGYKNRGLTGSPSKLEICSYFEQRVDHSLVRTTTLSEHKCNVFIWQAR